jgi:hypothetical protein
VCKCKHKKRRKADISRKYVKQLVRQEIFSWTTEAMIEALRDRDYIVTSQV